MEQTTKPEGTWNFVALGLGLLPAFAYHSFWLVVKYRGGEHQALWYEAQGEAGVALICVVLVRMLVAAIRGETSGGWKFYLALCLLSPLWIRAVFELVLKVRDGYAA